MSDLERRLPWLLVFRAVVATVLLTATLVVELSDGPLRLMAPLLYAVGIGTYIVVMLLGLLLKAEASPVVVAAVHLVTAEVAAALAVQATGGVASPLSFLYILVILDGAIIGARQLALILASASSLLYTFQLLAQRQDWLPYGGGANPTEIGLVVAAFGHVFAFYLVGALSGYLAFLLKGARAAASSARSDLKQAELLHNEVVAALPVGVITYDHNRVVLAANASLSKILDTDSAALVGRPLPAALQPLADGSDAFREHSAMIQGETRILWAGRSMVRSGDDSAGHRCVLVVEDRTELRALEQSLQAKERLAALGELAAAIAHEIRNPLAAVSGAVELLSDDPADPHTRRRLQDIVLREVDRLNKLVGDFLLYARPSAPQLAPVELKGLVEDVLSTLEREAPINRERMVVELGSCPRAIVDARQLRQVLLNLVRNAIDASGEGQTINIRLLARLADLVVEVEDYGEGIPASIEPHLFEPFRSTRRARTGLGLAVVHRIMEAHGARVEVDSRPGEGTLIRLIFPRAVEVPQPLEIVADA